MFGFNKNLFKKLTCLIFNIFCLIFISSELAFAQEGTENFEINLHSTYTITATGKAIVEQKFTIKKIGRASCRERV